MKAHLKPALAAWLKILGKQHVITDKKQLLASENAGFATRQKILAIIEPKNISEIQSCVKIANQYRIPLYPISTGKNWGYGSKVPATDKCVIVDLHHLNHIIDYNDELGYITLQAGVTQKQAADFLHQRKSRFFISTTGSFPDSSVIGNILERGDGSSIYADRCHYICGLEVILPNGNCIHTGFGNLGQQTLSKVHRSGLGPQTDCLFLQSNFGIITQMTIWLSPIPNYLQLMYFALQESGELSALIEAIRELKLAGVLKGSLSIWNQHKSQSKDKWQGCMALYSASKQLGLAEKALINKTLRSKTIKLQFVNFTQKEIMHYLYSPHLAIKKFSKFLTLIKFSQCLGIPNEKNIACLYSDKKTTQALISLCVAVPMTEKDITNAIKLIEKTAETQGFQPQIALLCLSERYLILPVLLIYNRHLPAADEKAMQCHDKILQDLIDAGYYPTRLGIQSMHVLSQIEESYKELMKGIKFVLDPFQIMAPGRYQF